jgi:branched-chain amino acid transport system substrate-binding protein
MRKKTIVVTLVVGVVALAGTLALSACGGGGGGTASPSASTAASTSAATGPIKIGYDGAQTGVAAAPGQATLQAVQLAVDGINAQGGLLGRQVELIVKDDGSDVTKGVANVTQLIQQDKVDAIIGPWVDFIAPAARAVEEKAGVPSLLPYGPAMGSPTNWKWTFSCEQTAETNANSYVEILKDHGWTNAVMVGDVLTISKDSIAWMKQKAPAAGIKLTAMPDTWALDVTDFGGIATKIKAACDAAKAQVLLLQANAPQIPSIMTSLKAVGFNLPVVESPDCGELYPLMAQGPAPVQGIIFPSVPLLAAPQLPNSYPAKSLTVAAFSAYLAKYKMAPDFFSAGGFDAVALLAKAITDAGSTDKAKVRDALEAIKDFETPGGVFTYSPTDHVGIHDSFWEYVVQGKGFKIVKQLQ